MFRGIKHVRRDGGYYAFLFGLVLLVLLFGGVALFVYPKSDDWKHLLFSGIAEGLIVAFFISAFVERYARKRFVHSVVTEAVWGMVNPQVSSEYRQLIGGIASDRLVYSECVFDMIFEWADEGHENVSITTEMYAFGKNYGDSSVMLKGYSWIVPSTNAPSEFLAWSFIDHAHPFSKHYGAEELLAETQKSASEIEKRSTILGVATDRDLLMAARIRGGDLAIDKSRLSKNHQIGPGHDYSVRRSTRMIRKGSGYLPVTISTPSVDLKINLRGSARKDLLVRLRQPDGTQIRVEKDAAPREISIGAMLRNNTVIIAWRPD